MFMIEKIVSMIFRYITLLLKHHSFFFTNIYQTIDLPLLELLLCPPLLDDDLEEDLEDDDLELELILPPILPLDLEVEVLPLELDLLP